MIGGIYRPPGHFAGRPAPGRWVRLIVHYGFSIVVVLPTVSPSQGDRQVDLMLETGRAKSARFRCLFRCQGSCGGDTRWALLPGPGRLPSCDGPCPVARSWDHRSRVISHRPVNNGNITIFLETTNIVICDSQMTNIVTDDRDHDYIRRFAIALSEPSSGKTPLQAQVGHVHTDLDRH